MFSFLKKTSAKETTLLVSVVTSYSVTGSVVRMYHTKGSVGVPVVLFSYEEKIPLRHGRNTELLQQSVLETLKNVLEKCRSFSGHYEKLICTVGEPWVESFSRTSHLEKKEPFLVSQKLIDDLILRESRLFEQEIIRDHQSTEEMGIVGISDSTIDINGYRTSHFIKTSAKSLDVHLTFSLAPAGFAESLIGIFTDVFHRTDVFISSMDTARSLLIPVEQKATVLHLGGTTSSLSIIDRGHSIFHSNIPDGLSSVEKNIAHLFALENQDISSVMKFSSDENILNHHRDVYYQRIEAAYRDLGISIRRGILELKRHVEQIPQPLVIVADPFWITVLIPMISQDIGSPVFLLDETFANTKIIYPQNVSRKKVSLSIAILQAVKNLK